MLSDGKVGVRLSSAYLLEARRMDARYREGADAADTAAAAVSGRMACPKSVEVVPCVHSVDPVLKTTSGGRKRFSVCLHPTAFAADCASDSPDSRAWTSRGGGRALGHGRRVRSAGARGQPRLGHRRRAAGPALRSLREGVVVEWSGGQIVPHVPEVVRSKNRFLKLTIDDKWIRLRLSLTGACFTSLSRRSLQPTLATPRR